jgi:hypothetical protein
MATAARKGLVKQRSLLPLEDHGPIEGWMDEDVASAATQLFGGGRGGRLVVDARELLMSTTEVIGAEFGETHLKTWMALVTMHVAHGMPGEARVDSSAAELSKLIWGEDRERGGTQTKRLVRTLLDLHDAKITVPGYDLEKQEPADGITLTHLFSEIYVDATILKAFSEPDHGLNRADFGKVLGAKQRGTIAWRMNRNYAERLNEAALRRFDWTKAQQLRGSALALWMLFTSPRVPYRPVLESREQLETVEVPLTAEHCSALGVHAATPAARRRTLNDAGRRVCAVDHSFKAFEARGGHGHDSFLRVVRERPLSPPLAHPYEGAAPQLRLVTA